ncbi:MAG: 5-(carboxyamino)imidazole ribonucleotide mutase [Vicinamibacteria bacterium]
MSAAKVLIVMGSDSDKEVMAEAAEVLRNLGIPYEMGVYSAHRTPERAAKLASEAASKGVRVLIAGAGAAAHLAGALASRTNLPVIGVPLSATPLAGLDALLATVQMPAGFPVATMAIGKPGARNAAFLAAQILATSDEPLAKKLSSWREEKAREVEEASEKMKREFGE